MEFLVDMTTRVPDGTPDGAVAEVRDREAARSRDLAARGALLRLWRPPLRPGEWRTLGLFAADDESRLGEVLASMPLRVWRSDEVTPLFAHPNDPSYPGSPRWAGGDPEFLTTFTVAVPDGVEGQAVAVVRAQEARRAAELAEGGLLVRLWLLEPDGSRALGLWRARDEAAIADAVRSLPLTREGWMTTETTPLSPHPNDPVPASA